MGPNMQPSDLTVGEVLDTDDAANCSQAQGNLSQEAPAQGEPLWSAQELNVATKQQITFYFTDSVDPTMLFVVLALAAAVVALVLCFEPDLWCVNTEEDLNAKRLDAARLVLAAADADAQRVESAKVNFQPLGGRRG